MALMPRFKAHEPNRGFDELAKPAWQMVPYHAGMPPLVDLMNAGGMAVTSVNENIAKVEDLLPSAANDPERNLSLTPVSPGTTFIEVRGGPGNSLLQRLEVSVKPPVTRAVSFQFVTDIGETTRTTDATDKLVRALNDVFAPQANLLFTKGRVASVRTHVTMQQILKEQDIDFIRPSRSWGTLTGEGDPAADVNVYFMQFLGRDEQAPDQVFGTDGDVVCPDGLTLDRLLIALPHMVGRSLGCPITDSDKLRHHLMFRSRATGNLDAAGGCGFIPKECADIINPPN
jgi:hypothetical protein